MGKFKFYEMGNKSELKQMTSEKYSLRPRNSVRRKFKFDDIEDEKEDFSETNDNTEKSDVNHGKNGTRHRPPPLSKYRRKTANARERSRMKEINSAFETLRKAVPSYMPELVLANDGANEKLTKITTLKLAMLYISGLTELLRKEEENEEERLRLLDESVESLVNYHPTLFKNGHDTCTLTALNTTTYDIFESSNSVLNDCGSDGESFHSGDTYLDNFIKEPIETLVPDLDLEFPDNLIDTELS